MQCVVLGGGSWGTALAIQLARNGHQTVLWDRNADRCEAMNSARSNPRYLRGVKLPVGLTAEHDLQRALAGAALVVPCVPSHALRGVLTRVQEHIGEDVVLCCATKGIEQETLHTMHEVMTSTLPNPERMSVLYGPSFALEVARGQPTAVVIAGGNEAAHAACEAFHGGAFRTYHTDDVIGVCIGGSLKNPMAIACGISDSLELGSNARAALITRGLAEITRLAVAKGANPLTMMGLAGMGDLVLTCTGSLSRNRRVGLGLGEGKPLGAILDELGEVAEGVTTTQSAHALAQSTGIDMPIVAQMHAILFEDTPAKEAIARLLNRQRRAERDDT